MPKYDLIEQDIAWCEANRNPDEKVYQDGFIAGLRHALFLMKRHPSVYSSPVERDWSGEKDKEWKYCICEKPFFLEYEDGEYCKICGKKSS